MNTEGTFGPIVYSPRLSTAESPKNNLRGEEVEWSESWEMCSKAVLEGREGRLMMHQVN